MNYKRLNSAPTPSDRLPRMMRAVQAVALGGPEVLRLVELPVPVIAPNEVLIRTAYAGVNFADVKVRRGAHHLTRKVPYLPGLDVSGHVVAVGSAVDGLLIGQPVAAATEGGAYAELVKAKGTLTYPLPDPSVDLRAVAGIVAMMTAYNVLMVKARLRSGESVVVHAAGGGVGTLLLQLAKHYGAGRVVAVVGSEAKAPVVRSLGADEVIVTRGENYAEKLAVAAPNGVDIVLDAVGGTMFSPAFARLAAYGRLVNFGDAAGQLPMVDPSDMHKKNLTLIGYSSGTYRKSRPDGVRLAATRMLELHASGALSVPIGEAYPLERAAEAHQAIESRASTGKLLLEVAPKLSGIIG